VPRSDDVRRLGNKDHEDSIRIIHRALDTGIDFIDTADIYSQGESEVIVGRALAGSRCDDVVLATKAWGPMGDEGGRDPNKRGVSRRWIVREVESSLKRLGTDWIDLYQIHRYEPGVDIEETLGALTDLVHQGKVRYIGSSVFPPSAIVQAQWTARDRGCSATCASSRPTRCSPAGSRPRSYRPARVRDGCDPVEPALRRLTVGQVAQERR
jgi:aryl-alcohol dehydrogenase-like predicted oxidoreductase